MPAVRNKVKSSSSLQQLTFLNLGRCVYLSCSLILAATTTTIFQRSCHAVAVPCSITYFSFLPPVTTTTHHCRRGGGYTAWWLAPVSAAALVTNRPCVTPRVSWIDSAKSSQLHRQLRRDPSRFLQQTFYSSTRLHMTTTPARTEASSLEHPSSSANTTTSTSTSTARMSHRRTLSEFLIERQQHPTSHWILGNAAGDTDSIVSALALAYVEDLIDHHPSTTPKPTPLVSISQQDLETQRPETLCLLQLVGITPHMLLYVNDPPIQPLRLPQRQEQQPNTTTSNTIQLTLVDHNRYSNAILSNALEVASQHEQPWKVQVVAIYDHHWDEQQHQDTCQVRNIAFDPNGTPLVASTCTLIAERLLRQQSQSIIPADVSLLLLGTILLDSINLNPTAGKVTPRDVAAVQGLLEHTPWEELWTSKNAPTTLKQILPNGTQQQPNTTALFDALQHAKFDPVFWKALSVYDAIRLDYKQFTATTTPSNESLTFGVSTVLLSLNDFVHKPSLLESLQHFMEHHNVPLLGVMLTYREKDPTHEGDDLRRQLILCEPISSNSSWTGSLVDELVEYLLTDVEAHRLLQLVERPSPVHDDKDDTAALHIRSFEQGNAKSSRKQVVPILLDYFAKKQ